jgi:hypothetical protein
MVAATSVGRRFLALRQAKTVDHPSWYAAVDQVFEKKEKKNE